MTMSLTQQAITILMVVLGTLITRFLPFIVFPAGKPTPKYIQYLGSERSAICCLFSLYFKKGTFIG